MLFQQFSQLSCPLKWCTGHSCRGSKNICSWRKQFECEAVGAILCPQDGPLINAALCSSRHHILVEAELHASQNGMDTLLSSWRSLSIEHGQDGVAQQLNRFLARIEIIEQKVGDFMCYGKALLSSSVIRIDEEHAVATRRNDAAAQGAVLAEKPVGHAALSKPALDFDNI